VLSKKESERADKAARRLPAHMQDVAFTKRSAAAERKWRDGKLGKMGAAGPVRRIDPNEYKGSL
jgi:hypothetical protein